jgi:hypothetical protein
MTLNEGVINTRSYYQQEGIRTNYMFEAIRRALDEFSSRVPWAWIKWKRYQLQEGKMEYELPPDCLHVSHVLQYPPGQSFRFYRRFPYFPYHPLQYGYVVQGNKIIFTPRGTSVADMMYGSSLPYLHAAGDIAVKNSNPSWTAQYQKGGDVVMVNEGGASTIRVLQTYAALFEATIEKSSFQVDDNYLSVKSLDFQPTYINVYLTSNIGNPLDKLDGSTITTTNWSFGYYVPIGQEFLNIIVYKAMEVLKSFSEEHEDMLMWRQLWEQELDRKRHDIARLQNPVQSHIESVV